MMFHVDGAIPWDGPDVWVWFLGGLLVLVVLLWWWWRGERQEFFRYRLIPSILTGPERVFEVVLSEALEGRWVLVTKIRLADFLKVEPGQDWGAAFRKICAKHVDFLICEPVTFRPLVAVELDDKSHERPERRARDEFLDRALASAGLPLVRVKTAKHYDVVRLREVLAPLLK